MALALGIAAFCLIPILGLLPIGLNANKATFEQTGAANVASAVVTDLRSLAWISPPVDQTSPYYRITVPGTPQGSAASTTLFVQQNGALAGQIDKDADPAQTPHYRVTLNFTATGTGIPNATAVRLLVTWPALADPSHATAPTRYAGSFETVAGLVRN